MSRPLTPDELKALKKRVALTDTLLKSIRPAPQGRRYAISDTTAPGLIVRVTDTGNRSFCLCKRMPGKAQATVRRIGDVGEMSLHDARETCRAWVKLVKADKDPKAVAEEKAEAERRAKAAEEAKAQNTIGKAWERYKLHIAHQRQAERVDDIFCRNLLPGWEDKPVHLLTRADVRGRIKAIAKRTVSQAFASFAILKPFLGWWRDETDFEGAIPTDGMSAAKVIGKKRKHRERVLGDDELLAFWRATRPERWGHYVEKEQRLIRGQWQSVSTIHPDRTPMASGCRMLLLCGARLNEIFESSRDEVTADGATLVIPPERFKSGTSHRIELPGSAQAIIASQPRRNSGALLFSCDGEKAARPWSKDRARIKSMMLRTLRAMARVRGASREEIKRITLAPFTLHDLRRTTRTRLSQLRVPREISEMIIGHAPRGLDRVYNQWGYTAECREALEKWSALLATIVTKRLAHNVIEISKSHRVMTG